MFSSDLGFQKLAAMQFPKIGKPINVAELPRARGSEIGPLSLK